MVAWPPMVPAPEPSLRTLGAGALLAGGLVGGSIGAAIFAGDASDVGGILPVGGSTLVLATVLLVLVAGGRLPMPRLGRSGVAVAAALLALAAWTGATVAWSIVPDRSWDATNRVLAYAAFLVVGALLAGLAGRVAARLGASLLAFVVGATLVWALLVKAVPALDPDDGRVARLNEPLDYWNALALLADLGLALGLWLGVSRSHPVPVRVMGALLTYAATLSLLLTLSRVGLIAGVAVLVLWLAVSRGQRVEGGLLLAASGLPAVLVGAWAFTRPALVEDLEPRADRVSDGALLAALALVGALVVAVLVALALRRSVGTEWRRRAVRPLAVAATLVALAAAAVLAVGVVDAVSSGRSCAEVENDPTRLASLDPNSRLCWWGEAWDVFLANSPEGAGAWTFEIARKRYRADARTVAQPHSVPFQQLADGGIAALVLYAALVAAGALLCVRPLRRLDGAERAAAVALVAVPAAYVVHTLVDYTWDFLGATAPTMFALGVLASAGRPAAGRRARPLLGVGAVLVAVGVLVSFASPRVAERSVREASRARERGDLELAVDRAERARTLNPLSVEPLFALARIEERRGRVDDAEQLYVDAVELQPENPETWYTLGLFEFEVRRHLCAAYRFLNDAYTLDPVGRQWVPGGELDQARDAVNAGACEP